MSLEREFSSTEYFDWLWIYKGPRLILELGAEERQSTLSKIFESVCDGKRREGREVSARLSVPLLLCRAAGPLLNLWSGKDH